MSETPNRLIMMIGLPHSGKSTAARQIADGLGCPIVCPDSIRLACYGQVSEFIGQLEPMVWFQAKTMVKALFLSGHKTVILDATNMTIERRNNWASRDWARTFVYMSTEPHECKVRVRKRATAGEITAETADGLRGAVDRQFEAFMDEYGDCDGTVHVRMANTERHEKEPYLIYGYTLSANHCDPLRGEVHEDVKALVDTHAWISSLGNHKD